MPITIKDAGIDIPKLPLPKKQTGKLALIDSWDKAMSSARTKSDLLTRFNAALSNFHLQGQHDQNSHGSWSTGQGDIDAARTTASTPVIHKNLNTIGDKDVEKEILSAAESQRKKLKISRLSLDVRQPTQVEIDSYLRDYGGDMSQEVAAWVVGNERDRININPNFKEIADQIISAGNNPISKRFPNKENPSTGVPEVHEVVDYISKSYSDIIVHEFGHILNNRLPKPERDSLKQFFTDKEDELAQDISTYASIKPNEGIAEAYVMAHHNESNTWSDKIKEVFKLDETK